MGVGGGRCELSMSFLCPTRHVENRKALPNELSKIKVIGRKDGRKAGQQNH